MVSKEGLRGRIHHLAICHLVFHCDVWQFDNHGNFRHVDIVHHVEWLSHRAVSFGGEHVQIQFFLPEYEFWVESQESKDRLGPNIP